MGCETAMDVEYIEDGVLALKQFQERNFQIHVLETIIPSTAVFEIQSVLPSNGNIALVVGNEEMGVDESIIAIADRLLHIPTFGKKNSLNVSIAFAITIYQFWSALLKT
jgi:tRNA G18 (ribose-2'-O)-methylase SpoU